MPVVWDNTCPGPELDATCDALATHVEQSDAVMRKHGGILLRDLHCLREAADFERAIVRMTPSLQ